MLSISRNRFFKFLVLFSLILLFVPACITDSKDDDAIKIETGTSFGMCVGYCKRTLQIEGKTATIYAESWRPEDYPKQKHEFALTDAEWDSLQALLTVTDMSGLEEVIGCPDCADGGAEWLAIKQDKKVHRSTFNYGANIPEIAVMMEFLRPIRLRGEELIAKGQWKDTEESGIR
ncbi:MAG: hypothetical protein H6696_09195 [Deferribacteres bacterium]|nr:hypothetical protein [candidate division KSB1 bacterium]MCB9502101.1 hypothetical protein [Deferribacteres bacterium]